MQPLTSPPTQQLDFLALLAENEVLNSHRRGARLPGQQHRTLVPTFRPPDVHPGGGGGVQPYEGSLQEVVTSHLGLVQDRGPSDVAPSRRCLLGVAAECVARAPCQRRPAMSLSFAANAARPALSASRPARLVTECAHKKGSGSTKNGRDSNSKRLGVKVYGDQPCRAGNIIIRQRGSKVRGDQGTEGGGLRRRCAGGVCAGIRVARRRTAPRQTLPLWPGPHLAGRVCGVWQRACGVARTCRALPPMQKGMGQGAACMQRGAAVMGSRTQAIPHSFSVPPGGRARLWPPCQGP